MHQNLPEAGFVLPKIYERVPREDEEGEDNVLCLGHRTEDGFEG